MECLVSNTAIIFIRDDTITPPRKNITPVCDPTILKWTIGKAFESGMSDTVLAKTNDSEISEVACLENAETPFYARSASRRSKFSGQVVIAAPKKPIRRHSRVAGS